MSKKRIFLIILLVLGAYVCYNYVYQDHRNISQEIATYNITANELNTAFLANSNQAEQQYLNKTITVSGTITEKTLHSITLNNKVFCQFTSALDDALKLNTKFTIKGRVIGYDDLLEQVKLDQCVDDKNIY